MSAKIVAAMVAAALAAAALYGAYHHGVTTTDATWQSRWDEQVAFMAEQRAEAEAAARKAEQGRQLAINEVSKNAQAQIERAEADAAAAIAAADGLRQQAQRLAAAASKPACSASPTNAGKAASSPGVVLADVFGRADQRAGELAAAYDRARVAGLACERAYDALLPSVVSQ